LTANTVKEAITIRQMNTDARCRVRESAEATALD
jgi:hypothetical protein